MKVACIGNMNNNFFSLTRYLRDEGLDTELVLLNTEHPHFMPECDSFNNDYTSYTRSVPWGDVRSFATPAWHLRRDLERYDRIICSSGVPAFLHKCGRQADIFTPYGSDLFVLPFLRNVRPSRYWLRNFRFAWSQRQGIREAQFLSLCPTDEEYEICVGRIRPSGNRLYGLLPMVYLSEYTSKTLATGNNTESSRARFQAIRNESEVMVYHHMRHMWTHAYECTWTKGNDVLVQGFAAFVQARPELRSSLVMFEYGPDYSATKALVRELGIEDRVHWFPVLPRKEIMVGLSLCDVASGEFHAGWIAGGVGQEVMASGKPYLSYMDVEMNRRFFPALPEVINVRTPEHIRDALEDLASDPAKYREIGERGRQWYEEYCIKKTISEYLDALGVSSLKTKEA